MDQTDTGGAVEAGDRFGASIIVGNFDADTNLDFAVAAPAEVSSGFSGGAVSIHKGASGIAGASTFQTSDGIKTLLENNGELGAALATGDIDGDGRDELVVGAPGSSTGNGNVVIFEKDVSTWASTQTITQTATRFGSTLAVGDFISDSVADIAVGANHDLADKGSVFTYRGTATTVVFAQKLSSNETDRFGEGLAIGNLVGGSKGDLIVGMPGEDFDPGPAQGEVIIYGGSTGTTVTAHTPLWQADGGFFDGGSSDTVLPPEHLGADNFGSNLIMYTQFQLFTPKVGLIVGAPTDTVDGATSGSAFVYYGTHADRKLDQVTMRHSDSLPY